MSLNRHDGVTSRLNPHITLLLSFLLLHITLTSLSSAASLDSSASSSGVRSSLHSEVADTQPIPGSPASSAGNGRTKERLGALYTHLHPQKRRGAFRNDFGKRLAEGTGLVEPGDDFVKDETADLRPEDREDDHDDLSWVNPIDDVTEGEERGESEEGERKEGRSADLVKRPSRFRSDFGKRSPRFRSDFGKRGSSLGDVEEEKRGRFKSDFGKRGQLVDYEGFDRETRRAFRADFGKRRYRNDFG